MALGRAPLFGALILACADRPGGAGNQTEGLPTWQPVVEQALQAFAEDGLPSVGEDQVETYLDLLDLATTGEQERRRAMQRLADEDPATVTSALLSVVEGREAEAYLRGEAYAWLQEHGVEAMVPRLTLRLKYEKDWVANVAIAVGLLRHGCGAGLEPMVTILRTEEGIPDLEEARWAAVAALGRLPEAPNWTPGASFDDDWNRLLEVDHAWRRDRRLQGPEGSAPPSRALRAEVWKTLAKFRSQPLRPVDDARYVLTRMPRWVFAPLCETTYDEDRYVREHALQSLAWSGAPVGAWALEEGFDLPGTLIPLLVDAPQRSRVLEAMGASGLASMQDAILPWLQQGGLEESTAAADALLRCGDEQVLRPITILLEADALLSPEGRYALELLRHRLDPEHAVQVPEGLDSSERARRDRWAQR